MEILAVKHLPFHAIPQSVQRIEDGRKRPAAVMAKQAGYVFKQQIRRLPGFSHSGKLKEQRSSGVCESMPASSNAETLARKSATEKFEIRHTAGVCFSDVVTGPLSPRVKQRAVAAPGVFVELTVPHAGEAPGTAQALTEPADAGEHVNKPYGFSHHAPF